VNTSVLRHQGGRIGVGILLAAALSGPLSLPAMAQGTTAVSMTEDSPEHYAFVPGATTVPVGATVTWTDMSDASHTVTSDTGAFGSSTLNPNQAFRFTFTQAGTYNYHCSIHSYMHGAITVTAAAPATAAPAPPSVPAPTSPSTAPSVTPAQVPARMPSTGAGGMAGASSIVGEALFAGAALLAALRRRR
jgi:plastocyanin